MTPDDAHRKATTVGLTTNQLEVLGLQKDRKSALALGTGQRVQLSLPIGFSPVHRRRPWQKSKNRGVDVCRPDQTGSIRDRPNPWVGQQTTAKCPGRTGPQVL